MDHSTALQALLQDHLNWNKARINFLARVVVALIKMSSVNLTQLACALNPNVKLSSNYRRLQRFLSGFEFDPLTLTRIVVMLLPNRLLLTLDRTSWKFGARYHNVLVIAACAEGIAIPLLWHMLPKDGASNTGARIALLEQLLKVVPPERITALVADREFIGIDWFGYLNKRKVRFVIRVSHTFYLSTRKGRRSRAKRVFGHLRPGEMLALKKRRTLCEVSVFVCAIAPRKGDDTVILISSEVAHRALAFYSKRWQIETLFSAMKSRGFDLESTHLIDRERVGKMIGLITIAFVWAYRVGQWVHTTIAPIARKTHGRRAQSVFRYGLDHLRMLLLSHTKVEQQFRQYLKLLSCT